MDYVPWLRQQLKDEESCTLKTLADGPNFEAISYTAYAVNGYVFYTADVEMNKITQNSGVSIKAMTICRSSAKDKKPVVKEVAYYGIVKQILELDYHYFKVVVFYCDWVCTEDATGLRVDAETNLIFVNMRRLKGNTKENDEPFILAYQETQVFYCKDHSRPSEEWHVVLDVLKRLNCDVDSFEDPLVFEARMNENTIAATLQDDIMEEDINGDDED